jgi:hypothetical protein
MSEYWTPPHVLQGTRYRRDWSQCRLHLARSLRDGAANDINKWFPCLSHEVEEICKQGPETLRAVDVIQCNIERECQLPSEENDSLYVLEKLLQASRRVRRLEVRGVRLPGWPEPAMLAAMEVAGL